MLRDLILDFLRQQPEVDQQKLMDPATKIKELGLDSLGLVEMLFDIEDKYGFQIEDPMRYNDMTVDEVVADIETAVRARHGGVMPDLPASGGVPSSKV